MATLLVIPNVKSSPEERAHNKALIERYMPELFEFFLEAREELDATMGKMKFRIPDDDLPFVQSLMDDTKRLIP